MRCNKLCLSKYVACTVYFLVNTNISIIRWDSTMRNFPSELKRHMSQSAILCLSAHTVKCNVSFHLHDIYHMALNFITFHDLITALISDDG